MRVRSWNTRSCRPRLLHRGLVGACEGHEATGEDLECCWGSTTTVLLRKPGHTNVSGLDLHPKAVDQPRKALQSGLHMRNAVAQCTSARASCIGSCGEGEKTCARKRLPLGKRVGGTWRAASAG